MTFTFRIALVCITKFVFILGNIISNKESVYVMFSAVGVICFGKRLGCLSDEKTGEMINLAVCETLQAMSVTWLGAPWWKLFPTPNFRKLVRTQDHLYETAAKSIQEAQQNFQLDSTENIRNPLIYELMRTDGPLNDQRDVATVTLELFQAGIEAVIHNFL